MLEDRTSRAGRWARFVGAQGLGFVLFVPWTIGRFGGGVRHAVAPTAEDVARTLLHLTFGEWFRPPPWVPWAVAAGVVGLVVADAAVGAEARRVGVGFVVAPSSPPSS